MDQLLKALQDIIGLFERLAIEYVVMGGLAARAHGIPRATYDIDFTIAIEDEKLPGLYAEAQGLGYSIPDHQLGGWTDRVSGMPIVKFYLFIEGRKIDIDVFLARSDFQKEVLKRRQVERVNGITLWMVSAEDLILLKLLASRPRDLADVADVLFTQDQLDEAYLRDWADRLHLRDALEKALSEFR